MNLGGYSFKRSRFEKVLNMLLVGNLCMSLTCTVLGTLGCLAFNNANIGRQYLYEGMTEEDLPFWTFQAFFRFYLIVNSFVPLDLLVVIEISKLAYTSYIEADAWMMEPDYLMGDIKTAKCNTLNLHEELG